MADTHGAAAHHGPNFGTYIIVFVALSIFTAVSFIINHFYPVGDMRGAVLIMMVAVVKACLVGSIFMHLKWDWPRLYFLIAPVFILAVMMMVVLLPDMVLVWHREAAEAPPAVRTPVR